MHTSETMYYLIGLCHVFKKEYSHCGKQEYILSSSNGFGHGYSSLKYVAFSPKSNFGTIAVHIPALDYIAVMHGH